VIEQKRRRPQRGYRIHDERRQHPEKQGIQRDFRHQAVHQRRHLHGDKHIGNDQDARNADYDERFNWIVLYQRT